MTTGELSRTGLTIQTKILSGCPLRASREEFFTQHRNGKTMSKPTQLSAFATDNPTDKWAIVIDGVFGYVTKAQAKEFLDTIGKRCIDDTVFGSWKVLPPGHRCDYINGTRESHGVVSCADFQPIDIIDYTKKAGDRFRKNCELRNIANPEPASVRHEREKAFASLWGE